jgi:hypothetical protein
VLIDRGFLQRWSGYASVRQTSSHCHYSAEEEDGGCLSTRVSPRKTVSLRLHPNGVRFCVKEGGSSGLRDSANLSAKVDAMIVVIEPADSDKSSRGLLAAGLLLPPGSGLLVEMAMQTCRAGCRSIASELHPKGDRDSELQVTASTDGRGWMRHSGSRT